MSDLDRKELERYRSEYKATELKLTDEIREKSQVYLTVCLVALISYPFSVFGPGWVSWISLFLTLGALNGEFSVFGAIMRLHRFEPTSVYRVHSVMALLAVVMLIYSLVGLWKHWPLPWLTLMVALVINFLHGVSFGLRNSGTPVSSEDTKAVGGAADGREKTAETQSDPPRQVKPSESESPVSPPPSTPIPMDCLTFPSGDRLTASRMMAARAALPPTRTTRSRTMPIITAEVLMDGSKPKPMDCLTLPSGYRLTRSDLIEARRSLPPTRTTRSRTMPTITPEQEQKLLPVLVRAFDAAFRLGYIKFRDAAKFVLDEISKTLGQQVADQISLEHLQAAYITLGKREGVDGIGKVGAVEDKSEIENHTAEKSA